MAHQSTRVPPGPGDVVREVRGLTGVPWRRLVGYVRPHLRLFGLALAGLILSAGPRPSEASSRRTASAWSGSGSWPGCARTCSRGS